MAHSAKPHDMRVRNVRLHQRAKKQRGTLALTKHHLTFTVSVDEAHEDTGAASETEVVSAQQHAPSLSAGSSTLSQASTADTDEQAHGVGDGPSKPRQPRPKPRTKTLWVPYPMVNYCVLRPSHMQSSTIRPQTYSEDSNKVSEESEDSFPPTYGSSTYGRPSTDSTHLAPYSSPRRPASPAASSANSSLQEDSGRSPAIRVRCRDFQMMAFHFHPDPSEDKSPDEIARQIFFKLRRLCCVDSVEEMLAFHFQPPHEEMKAGDQAYDPRREFSRMGISGKSAEGPGSAWRITDINHDYSFSATYPSVLCVPRNVSDNMLKYGGVFRSRSRIPSLAYLHFNGGSITRSSQPMVGLQGKRNPQDERLVSAIFSSHTPPLLTPEDTPPQLPSLTSTSTTTLESTTSDTAALDSDIPGLPLSHSDPALDEKGTENVTPVRRKVYGSTRRNLIVDARPKINALANRATGGGIEDISNYMGIGDVPVEKIFLNIQNIHVMRSSLEKVIDSFANSDYVNLGPDQEILRKSGWLGHIAGLLEGSELVARAVGLTGSHVLVHCSDGWDRTSQVCALAQAMLDPHYRTFNGFITLVQKDFLSYGHKFRDRNGIQGSEKWFEIENERITSSRARDGAGSDSSSLNALSSKALSGAKSWFEKNRGSLFRQQNASHDNLTDAGSHPASPPPNPIIHSPPFVSGKDEKEHKTSQKEIAPIFHQFLEAVWQLQRQYPTAFEFNERFLLRLLYQTYAGQYGEFLFNSEKDRWQHEGKTPSVWAHFLARRADFISPDYTTNHHDALLLPKRGGDQQIEVRWWSKLFGRGDEEMNVPRALAPVDPPSLHAQPSSVSFDEGAGAGVENGSTSPANDASLREAKSTPNFSTLKDGFNSSFSALSMQPHTNKPAVESATTPTQRPTIERQDTEFEVLPEGIGSVAPTAANGDAGRAQMAVEQPQEEGDPLGVTSSMATKQASDRLDFAAFAAQNSYRDR